MEQFITSKGIPIRISDSLKGEKVLLLLHGYLETLHIWQTLEDALKEREDIRIITMDIPGHGLSGYKTGMDYSFIAEVIDGVLDNRGVDKCFIGGHSMGGYIAQQYLKMFPERLQGVILFNSAPVADSPEKKEERKREIKVIEDRKLTLLATASFPKMFAHDNLRKYDEFIIEMIENCETHNPEGIVASIEAMMGRDDQILLLTKSTVPVLFIQGDQDVYFPLEKIDLMKSAVPSAKFEIIQGTGHISFVEAAEQCAQILDSFLG